MKRLRRFKQSYVDICMNEQSCLFMRYDWILNRILWRKTPHKGYTGRRIVEVYSK